MDKIVILSIVLAFTGILAIYDSNKNCAYTSYTEVEGGIHIHCENPKDGGYFIGEESEVMIDVE